MIAGIGIDVFGLATRPASHIAQARAARTTSAATQSPVTTPATRPPGTAPPAATAGPYAPALSTGLYAQNRFYAARAALTAQTTITYSIETRFTERLTIGFDRPVAACVASQGQTGHALRVFSIAGVPGYTAVAFFNTAQRLAARESVVCTLAQPASSMRTDGSALAPLDPILAHHRLEYAAHAKLSDLPQALFPPRDPRMRRLPVALTGAPQDVPDTGGVESLR
jgi:hypothetical protein